MTAPLPADRIEALLREADRQQRVAPPPKRKRAADRYYGTFMEPRSSTDPSVDDAARAVGDAILQEPGNQQQFLSVRQCYSLAVPDPRERRAVYEWNVNRIINDRVWDWMLWMSKNGPAIKNTNPPLPEGYFRATLYHQCGLGCERTNLLRAAASTASGVSLTACVTSGIVHLCRANSKSCTVLDETDETELVCQESGRVCRDVGVHMSGAGDMRFMKAQRGIELEMGVRSDGGNRSSADPESVRRADAIEAMRATCPQIVGWDRETGELTVNMTIAPDQAVGEAFFDPSFYWVRASRHGAGEGGAMVTQALGSEPREAESYVSALGTVTQAMQTVKKRWQRATRAKRTRTATKHRQRRCAGPCVSHERSELLTEKDTIERVLDHVLWDAETRERVNAAHKKEVSDAVAHNLQHHIQPRNVSDLLTSMARPHAVRAAPEPIPMTADAVHAVCMATLRTHMVPVICFDEALHTQLVKIVLYLWNVVVHVPEEEQRAYRPKKRRYRDTPAASLTRFTLAVLYTAASSGIYIRNRAAWPKDWWLADHLPAERTLGLYYGAKQKLCDHHRLRRRQGGRDPLDYVSPTTLSAADPPKPRRDYQTTALYDTKDVACGNRELVAALSMYDGDNPTPEEVAAYLWGAYTDAYRGSPGKGSSNNNNTTEVDDTAKGQSGASITTTTATTMTQARSTTPVRFCCMFVPRNGAAAEPKRLVHVCVMFDPYDAAGPPMLQKYSDNVAGHYRLDTIIGPFVHDVDAREFCVEWARDRCGIEARRGFGIRLAQRLGLHIWVEEASPFSGMEAAPEPAPMADDPDPFATAIPARRGVPPPYIARATPPQRDMFALWSAFSIGDGGGKRIADSVVYDQDEAVDMETEEARAPADTPPDVAYHLFRHWQL